MRATAHRFAVGVEDQRSHVSQAVGDHGFGKAALQAFDGQGRRDLADEAPGIGKAGLDRHPPAAAGIGLVMRLGQHRIEEAPAVLQRTFGLEQG